MAVGWRAQALWEVRGIGLAGMHTHWFTVALFEYVWPATQAPLALPQNVE